MMAIVNQTLTIAGVDIFTCPGTLVTDEQEHALTCMIFCNITGSDVSITIHAVPQGSLISGANKIVETLLVPATETFTLETEKIILSTGDKIHALATANSSIIATVSSVRVS
jgi:hypothetical protein